MKKILQQEKKFKDEEKYMNFFQLILNFQNYKD